MKLYFLLSQSILFITLLTACQFHLHRKNDMVLDVPHGARVYKPILQACNYFYGEDEYPGLTAEIIFSDSPTRDFVWSIQNNDLNSMEQALKNGVDINAKGKYGFTPLACAFCSKKETFEWLLKHGANPNDKYFSIINVEIPIVYLAISEYIHANKNPFHLDLMLVYGVNPDSEWRRDAAASPCRLIKTLYDCPKPFYSIYDTKVLELIIKQKPNLNPPEYNYLREFQTCSQTLILLQAGAEENRSRTYKLDSTHQITKESFIIWFSEIHRGMDGYTKDEYKSFADLRIESALPGRYTRAELYKLHLQQWASYWEMVEFLRKKGYNLKSESECAISSKLQNISPGILQFKRLL